MNLLNNIVQKPNINLYQANSQSRRDVSQNIFAPIHTTNLIKPDRPERSYIVKDPFYMAPVNFVTDIKENIVNIVKATMGKSNDHDLGRINDFSMKAGALALAGYLFTHGRTSLAKSMEFIGFGSFFASMALWPKLFIETPLKAMYGLDIHQKYVDNEGRKKMFFQDPQYIPWDLYSDDELSKLGDRLGVPRDIHNRNEVIKKKAHKIALQGNTLWMLTAGFATPLMSALMCNGIEKIMTPRSERATFPNNIFGAFASSIEKMRIDRAERRYKNADAIVNSKAPKLDQSSLNAFLTVNKDEELTDKVIRNIANLVSKNDDVLSPEVIENQIRALARVETVVQDVTPAYFDSFIKECEGYTSKIAGEDNQKIWKELFNQEKLKSVLKQEADDSEAFIDNVRLYLNNQVADNESRRHLFSIIIDKIADKLEPVSHSSTKSEQLQKKVVRRILDEDCIQNILRMDRKLYEYSIRKNLLEDYRRLFLGEVGDSIATNRWLNAAKAFYEALGYKKEELLVARNEGLGAKKLLLSKLEALATDDDRYQDAIRKIQRAVLDYDRMFLPDKENGEVQGMKKTLIDVVESFADKSAKIFEESGFDVLKERMVGNERTSLGCLKDNLVDRIVKRTESIRSDIYKLIYSLDFFRRTAGLSEGNMEKSSFVKLYKSIIKEAYSQIDVSDDFDEKQKEIIRETYRKIITPEFTEAQFLEDLKQYKNVVVDATISDHTVKHNYQNPQRGLYKRLMSLIYSRAFDEKTNEALGLTEKGDVYKLGDIDFSTSLKNRIREVYEKIGNFRYNHATDVIVEENLSVASNAIQRDSLVGKQITNFLREAASNAYNSSKWMGIFGTMSAVLVGVTLLSQVFFGKIDKKDIEYVRKDDN